MVISPVMEVLKQTPTFIAFDVNQLVIKETELHRQGEITIQQEIELP
jgi:hypothetical protein